MLKETITFIDFNGVQRTEDHYFNLTKAEIAKMEMSTAGGFAEMISRIVAAQDQPAIIKVFEELIHKAYGVKTPDGRGFDKDPKHLQSFIQTEAYSELFMKLATDSDYAAKFINGVFPADLVKQMQENQTN